MSVNPHAQLSVTWKQVAAFRLARHHLAERAPAQALLPVVYDMAGAQAQLLPAARISLWARLQDLQIADIEKALSRRTLVRASCMRRTVFLVPAEHLAMYVRGSTQRAQRESTWALGKGVPARVLDAATDAALAALDQPLTRREIAERVCRALGVRMRSYRGGGWGGRAEVAAVPVGHLTYPVVDLLHLAAVRGVVCYGPNRGNEPTFVRADAWIRHWRDLPVEQAEGLLLRTYLRAYGPATSADFSMWCGISFKGARRIWAREEAGCAPVDVAGWPAAVLRDDVDALAQARLAHAPVRLLPYFDSFIFGHREREQLVAPEHQPRVYRPQGWVAPVVLVNGRIAGVWAHARQGDRLSVTVSPFAPLSRRAAANIRAEARSLGRFLGTADVEVQMSREG